MQLITDPSALKRAFIDNLEWCEKFSCATAWAGIIPGVTKSLCTLHRRKIKQMVVGIHFYQTDPEFIRKFLDSDVVKFILQSDGTFHPKVYFFEKGFDWRLMIGSANLTDAAFSKNTEATCVIDSKDMGASKVKATALNLINENFAKAEKFSQSMLDSYSGFWKRRKKTIDVLADRYGEQENRVDDVSRSDFLCDTLKMDWKQYYQKVSSEKGDKLGHCVDRRVRVIRMIRDLFKRGVPFSQLALMERKLIAGLPSDLTSNFACDRDWGYFGSMSGAGEFHNLINENESLISDALDKIPLKGDVTKENFDAFIKIYLSIPKKVGLANASRLLAMKRPDVFMCLDSKNKCNLCKEFGIKQDFGNGKDIQYDRYWDEIVVRILNSNWWNSEKPTSGDNLETTVWECRAAFIDSLFYAESSVSEEEVY